MRGRFLRAVLLLAGLQGLIVLLYLAVQRSRRVQLERPFPAERLAEGPSLPDVPVRRLDGSTIRLGSLRGRPVVLHFWATWCPPCREELPGLLDLPQALGGSPRVEVVAVALDHGVEAVRAFFAGDPPDVVVEDPSGLLRDLFQVGRLPVTFLVGPDGTAVLRFAGPRDWRSAEAHEILRSALPP
ncbi:MAG: TlpA family protein disulfide reductase [Deltaproteobacteria bacterium]|nr:TlpA family protein disulfide reductase [Deltaproteobacteria bacterium]